MILLGPTFTSFNFLREGQDFLSRLVSRSEGDDLSLLSGELSALERRYWRKLFRFCIVCDFDKGEIN